MADGLVCSWNYNPFRTLMIPLQNSPKSSGVREETRFSSITTGASSQFVPAFIMSSFMAEKLVAFLPFNIFAEIGTQPA